MARDAKAVNRGVTGGAECGGDLSVPDGVPPGGNVDGTEGCGCRGYTGV